MNSKYKLSIKWLLLMVFPFLVGIGGKQPGTNWPGFRGPTASGIAEGYATPREWDVPQSKNIKWRTAIPGLGHSSPVIWGDRIFVTTAISGAQNDELKVGLYGNIAPVNDESVHKWQVYCMDKNSGEILWQQTAHEGVPEVKRHTKSTQANPTPATDGKHVVTFFGSEGLYCYDMNGKLLWQKDLGLLDSGYFMVPAAQWGFGSSPVIYEDKVIIQCDVQKNSFIAAFNIANGEEIWRTSREDVPTWGTPTVHRSDGRMQIIVNGYRHIGGYDLETGEELWRLKGGGDIPVPTPAVAHGLAFVASAHGGKSPLFAIRLNASGDITLQDGENSNEHIAWVNWRNGAYMQTPLVYGDYLYSSRDNGGLTCYIARTGEVVYQERLGSGRTGFTASPVAADGKLYFTSELGDVHVIAAGEDFELLSVNPLGEVCMATPAISEGTLFFRAQKHVIAVGQK